MNEAWILSGEERETTPDGGLQFSQPRNLSWRRTEIDLVGSDRFRGRYLLDGPEIWYYEAGAKQYEANWSLGHKTGYEPFGTAGT